MMMGETKAIKEELKFIKNESYEKLYLIHR